MTESEAIKLLKRIQTSDARYTGRIRTDPYITPLETCELKKERPWVVVVQDAATGQEVIVRSCNAWLQETNQVPPLVKE